MNQKEKYSYDVYAQAYRSHFTDGIINEIKLNPYNSINGTQPHPGYTIGDIAKGFIDQFKSRQLENSEPDFFEQKNELADDRVALTMVEIESREKIRFDNLQRLYDDLLRIDNLKLKLSHPDNYLSDKTQIDLLRIEIQAREMIRKELKDAAKDLGFINKDLRESLLESKIQHQKTAFINSGLEEELDTPRTAYEPWGGLYR